MEKSDEKAEETSKEGKKNEMQSSADTTRKKAKKTKSTDGLGLKKTSSPTEEDTVSTSSRGTFSRTITPTAEVRSTTMRKKKANVKKKMEGIVCFKEEDDEGAQE